MNEIITFVVNQWKSCGDHGLEGMFTMLSWHVDIFGWTVFSGPFASWRGRVGLMKSFIFLFLVILTTARVF